MIHALIATPQTDAKLSAKERAKGRKAHAAGLPLSSCPWRGGLVSLWWTQGWEEAARLHTPKE